MPRCSARPSSCLANAGSCTSAWPAWEWGAARTFSAGALNPHAFAASGSSRAYSRCRARVDSSSRVVTARCPAADRTCGSKRARCSMWRQKRRWPCALCCARMRATQRTCEADIVPMVSSWCLSRSSRNQSVSFCARAAQQRAWGALARRAAPAHPGGLASHQWPHLVELLGLVLVRDGAHAAEVLRTRKHASPSVGPVHALRCAQCAPRLLLLPPIAQQCCWLPQPH